MNNFVKITILTACLVLTMGIELKSKLPIAGQRTLMTFMMQTSELSAKNPALSMQCFSYYTPLLNGITTQYEKDYAACLDGAQAARKKADEATKPQRLEIENSVDAACKSLKACAAESGSVDYFQCFTTQGSDTSKSMYSISTNSQDALANVQEEYRLIENNQNRCTSTSEQKYVENTSSTYDDLQKCLKGQIPVPTTTTTTTTVEPTTTTVAPTTTTVEPTTPSAEPSSEETTTTVEPTTTTVGN